jgi:hypothetical protein
VRDCSENPLWSEAEQRLQQKARPGVITEGHAQKSKKPVIFITGFGVLIRYDF